ncbi:MAG TPA: hypothetical protein VM261_20505 [Kofleriaceae bacterium]|nr:hypothetical protein [Kofleriaceae bacterium]
MDRNTGEAWIQARDGTKYSLEEVEAIEARAKRGDAAAASILESLDVTGMTPGQYLHDCPECRAAMAFGEVPEIYGPDEIAAILEAGRRDDALQAALLEAGLLESAATPQLAERPRTGRPVMRRRPFRRRHR